MGLDTPLTVCGVCGWRYPGRCQSGASARTSVSVCQSVSHSICHTKRVERSTGRNFQPIFTKLAIAVVSPDVITYCFWWKSRILTSFKLEVGLIFTIAIMEKYVNVKYLENDEKYDDGINWSQIRNHSSAIDWHHDLWPWMNLSRLRSRSQDFASNMSNTVRNTMLDTMEVT